LIPAKRFRLEGAALRDAENFQNELLEDWGMDRKRLTV
jgi:hypothetical protein